MDVPQAALILFATSAAVRSRPIWAGVALGLCVAMKPTATIAVYTLMLLTFKRSGLRDGVLLVCSALATAAVVVVPFLVRDPRGLVDNAILFPVGRFGPESPAESPFPGVLLRQAGAPALLQTLVVLGVAGAYALWCLQRIDGSALGAAKWTAVGMVLAFAVAPYSRSGYLVVPVLCYFTAHWLWATPSRPEPGRHLPASPVGRR